MHAIIGLLTLLLAAPSFEGKWQAEKTNPGGDKVVLTCELKADGKGEVSIIDKDGKVFAQPISNVEKDRRQDDRTRNRPRTQSGEGRITR